MSVGEEILYGNQWSAGKKYVFYCIIYNRFIIYTYFKGIKQLSGYFTILVSVKLMNSHK